MVMTSLDRIAARSTTFFSSRTLPGHLRAVSASRTAGSRCPRTVSIALPALALSNSARSILSFSSRKFTLRRPTPIVHERAYVEKMPLLPCQPRVFSFSSKTRNAFKSVGWASGP